MLVSAYLPEATAAAELPEVPEHVQIAVCMAASTQPSVSFCCSVLILEDHDCVHIAKGAFEVFNAHQASPSKSVQRCTRS